MFQHLMKRSVEKLNGIFIISNTIPSFPNKSSSKPHLSCSENVEWKWTKKHKIEMVENRRRLFCINEVWSNAELAEMFEITIFIAAHPGNLI
jgi:hypothetical protein